MNPKEHVYDQLPAYALGSLEEEEEQQVKQHLNGCLVCRAELQGFQNVAEQLALATPLVEPPASLRDKILQIPDQKAQIIKPARETAGFLEIFRSLITPWRLVGALLIVVLVTSNLFLWQQVQQLRSASKAQQFTSINLAGTNIDPQAHGLIVMSNNGLYGTLIVENLRPLDANHQYQLWLIQNGQRTSGGVFSVSWDGYASLWVDAPKALSSYTSFGITIEPKGGSPLPTGNKVMGGGL